MTPEKIQAIFHEGEIDPNDFPEGSLEPIEILEESEVITNGHLMVLTGENPLFKKPGEPIKLYTVRRESGEVQVLVFRVLDKPQEATNQA